MPGRHRRGRREPGHLQAAAAGRGDRRLPGRRLPGRRRQRGAGRAADGGEVRRAGLPARRRRRPLRVRPAPGDLRLPAGRHVAGGPDGRVRRPPARALRRPGAHAAAAATCCPTGPATASTMQPESIAEFSLPGRPGMAVTTRPRLGLAALRRLPAECRPLVAPGACRTGIVHLGLGAFHRAHQAVYTEEAIAAAGGDWGIVGGRAALADVVDALPRRTACSASPRLDGAGARHPGGRRARRRPARRRATRPRWSRCSPTRRSGWSR